MSGDGKTGTYKAASHGRSKRGGKTVSTKGRASHSMCVSDGDDRCGGDNHLSWRQADAMEDFRELEVPDDNLLERLAVVGGQRWNEPTLTAA